MPFFLRAAPRLALTALFLSAIASVTPIQTAWAGEFTAAYPRSSPGGWHLLGHTDVQLWDLDRRPPALLTPGTRVRFEAE